MAGLLEIDAMVRSHWTINRRASVLAGFTNHSEAAALASGAYSPMTIRKLLDRQSPPGVPCACVSTPVLTPDEGRERSSNLGLASPCEPLLPSDRAITKPLSSPETCLRPVIAIVGV